MGKLVARSHNKTVKAVVYIKRRVGSGTGRFFWRRFRCCGDMFRFCNNRIGIIVLFDDQFNMEWETCRRLHRISDQRKIIFHQPVAKKAVGYAQMNLRPFHQRDADRANPGVKVLLTYLFFNYFNSFFPENIQYSQPYAQFYPHLWRKNPSAVGRGFQTRPYSAWILMFMFYQAVAAPSDSTHPHSRNGSQWFLIFSLRGSGRM